MLFEPEDLRSEIRSLAARCNANAGSVNGLTDNLLNLLGAAYEATDGKGVPTLAPILPLLLTLKGKPYTIANHFVFEPFFNTYLPSDMLLRTGRQVSKCQKATSHFNRVYDEYGRRYRLSDILPGQAVQSFDPETFRTCRRKVLAQHKNPRKVCYYVRTRRGVEMELAGTHPLYTYHGWTPVEELDVGARIAHARCGGRFGNKKVHDRRILVTAYMLGDGSFRGNYNFTANRRSQAIIEMRSLLGDFREYRKSDSQANTLVLRRNHVVYDWAREDRLAGKLSHEKQIPGWVFLLSRTDTRTFIERLWATDGMIKPGSRKATITYTSTSRDLVYDLKSLLAKFGIPSAIKQRTGAYKKPDGRKVECRQYWRLRVETREGWQTFMREFTVPGKPGFELPETDSNNNRYTVPIEIAELIADIGGDGRGNNSRSGPQIKSLLGHGLRRKPKYPPSTSKLQEYLAFFQKHRPEHPRLEEFAKHADSDADWDEIVEIRNIGEHACVDIEVEETHSYLLDGVVSHNSTSLASQGVISTASIPYFNTLYVTPLFEMVRRFSNNYVREFIDGAVFKKLWGLDKGRGNVLQRSFRNGSNMFFSYAFLDAERTRGVNADRVCFDEVQNLMFEFVPVILETLSGSSWALKQYAGTPKSKDNTIEKLWRMSSMAEWFIKCQTGGCNHWNIPALEFDLLKMIGPDREDISEKSPAVVCSKCTKPLQPRTGRWVHRHPNRLGRHPQSKADFAGYHVPQIIMPLHYASRDKWRVLLAKRLGAYNTNEATFLNEVCGEACDIGTKLVNETDLERAGVLHENKLELAVATIGKYDERVLAVDWGGGGIDGVSWTVFAVLGWKAGGEIDVIYGLRSLTPHNHEEEAETCLKLLDRFRCRLLVHDYNGAGAYREKYVIDAGFPLERVIPCAYVRTGTQSLMRKIDATEDHPRQRFHIDKPRSLVLTCHQIKHGRIKFFKYDNNGSSDPGVMSDFLALTEDKVDTRLGRDIYTIIRAEGQTDDFAQAVNMGCCALWYRNNVWPDMGPVAKYQISASVLAEISPAKPNWSYS